MESRLIDRGATLPLPQRTQKSCADAILKIETQNSLVSLCFEDYGPEPVILIYGWPLSRRIWEYQVAPLVKAGHRVISYDRRGFGDSDKPWDGYTYDAMVADLQALITALDLCR